MKICSKHMRERLSSICWGHAYTALCWSTFWFQSLMLYFRVGNTPNFLPSVIQGKMQLPINRQHPLPFLWWLYVGSVRLLSLCLCFSLGRNLASWLCPSKCTDTSLMFRHYDITHMLNFQGHASVLCWNKARVLNTCQGWIFAHSAHFTLYPNWLVSFKQMQGLTFCLPTFLSADFTVFVFFALYLIIH